jgi:hypothetical protein
LSAFDSSLLHCRRDDAKFFEQRSERLNHLGYVVRNSIEL